MAKKILILRWAGSAYDSLAGLLELTAQALTQQGWDVLMLAVEGADWPRRLLPVLRQGEIAFALTMSGIGVEASVDGRGLWDATGVPLFNWCCDHPCYFPSRHVMQSPFVLHGYVFPDHARYNLAHLAPNGTAFAVHLGIPPRDIFAAAPLPAARRNGRLVFAKSGRNPNEIEAKWRQFIPDLSHILFAGAEELMPRTTGDFIQVLQDIAASRGLFFAGNTSLAMLLINELDAYIRFRRADLVLRSVLDQPVDVFGTGWDHIEWSGALARYHGPLPWQEMIQQLPSYAGCLSINPLINESVHDRVFFALAAGVAPVSDSNGFSRAYMPGLERFAFGFTADSVRRAVAAVLDDTDASIAATEACWTELSGPFGLRRSAAQIVQFASLHGVNKVVRP